MPKIDTSLGIVGIIAIVALLSPPITAIIENLFKLIAKWIDYRHTIYDNEHAHKRKLFEDFLHCTGLASYDPNSHIGDLLHAYYVLIPYIPAKKLPCFRTYCTLLQDGVDPHADELSSLLHKEIVPCIKKEFCRRRLLRR